MPHRSKSEPRLSKTKMPTSYVGSDGWEQISKPEYNAINNETMQVHGRLYERLETKNKTSNSVPLVPAKALNSVPAEASQAKPADRGRRTVSKQEYKVLAYNLSLKIKEVIARLEHERGGKVLKKFPSTERTDILESFARRNDLVAHVSLTTLWNTAATIAREGKKVSGNDAGEVNCGYKMHHYSETNAAESTAQGEGFVALFPNEGECSKFAVKSLACKEKREEFDERVKNLGGKVGGKPGGDEKEIDAMFEMKQVVPCKCLNCTVLLHLFKSHHLLLSSLCVTIMTDDEAKDLVLVAIRNGHSVQADATNIEEHGVHELIRSVTKSFVYGDREFVNRPLISKNNIKKILSSKTCHQKVFVSMAIIMVMKGLAFVQKWTTDGKEFHRIFTSVSIVMRLFAD